MRSFWKILILISSLLLEFDAVAMIESDLINIDHNWKTVHFQQTLQNPVVFIGPPTFHGGQPGVVRVRSVSENSFEVSFQEWLYLDGIHVQETIPYLLLQQGRHQMDDGSIWEVGTFPLSGTGIWMSQSFDQAFSATPSLFLTAQTTNGPDPVVVRAHNVSVTGFEAAIFEEEAKMDGHTNETIGYLAIYSSALSGSVDIGADALPYLLQRKAINHIFTPVLSSTLKVEEEQSFDNEISHIDETIAILAIGEKLFAQDTSSTGSNTSTLRRLAPEYFAAMEWGVVNSVNHNWLTVPLTKQYINPVVVVRPVSVNGVDPGVIRIRNVSGNSFQLRYSEWEYLNGNHILEQAFYLVVEKGQRSVAGLTVEAETINSALLMDDGWETVNFNDAFAEKPGVFTSVQTSNGRDPVTTRLDDVSSVGFYVTMDEEEFKRDGHTTETIGWIAIEQGSGITADDRVVTVEVLNKTINHIPQTINFNQTFARRFPVVVADIVSTYGGDTCFLRHLNLTPSSVDLFIAEEQSLDLETNHILEDLSLFVGDPTFIQLARKERLKNNKQEKYQKHNDKNLFAKINIPYHNSLVRANVPIFGLAYGEKFKEYRVEYGEGTKPSEWITVISSSKPQTKNITAADLDNSLDLTIHGNLATWDTGLKNYIYLPSHPKDHHIDLKGTYTIRLVVIGKDGGIVEDRVTVEVANVIPNALGGKATSKDGKVVIDVPEQALMDSFRLISIKIADNSLFVFPHSRKLIGDVYEVREPGERFTKEAVLQMSLPEKVIEKTNPNRLGLYGYDSNRKEWEYLDSIRSEVSKSICVNVRELYTYYALMESDYHNEGSTLAIEKKEQNKKNPNFGSNHYFVKNTFEDGLGGWSNRDNEVGAQVLLNNTATFDGTQCLKITNTHSNGNFAVNIIKTPFDVKEYPLVQFDYRISPDIKTNFLVKVTGRWYDIGFTDENKKLRDKRINIAHIGDITDILANDKWHTAQFNLYNMLRTKTGNTLVEEMIMADWDVGGYMKLQFGQNRAGMMYYIDNFSIRKEVSAGLRIAQETILIDDFNKKKETNALGGSTRIFCDGINGHLEPDYSNEDMSGKGHSLKLAYDVSQSESYAGYITYLQNLDLRNYHTLSFFIKSTEGDQDFLIGLKDKLGGESKLSISRYLPDNRNKSWQKVDIPLVAFSDISDWGRIENLSLTFVNSLHDNGVVHIDNLEFLNEMKSFMVDNFESTNERNFLERKHQVFANGNAAINGKHTKGSPNGIYRVSYGGNIGKIKAYASDLLTFAGWTTKLGGIDCSQCRTLSFRIKGAEGGEYPNIYIDDGNFRWSVDIEKYVEVTTDWKEVTIPLDDFSDYGVDLTHLAELQYVFEWEKMSGTIYLDDIQFGSLEYIQIKTK